MQVIACDVAHATTATSHASVLAWCRSPVSEFALNASQLRVFPLDTMVNMFRSCYSRQQVAKLALADQAQHGHFSHAVFARRNC